MQIVTERPTLPAHAAVHCSVFEQMELSLRATVIDYSKSHSLFIIRQKNTNKTTVNQNQKANSDTTFDLYHVCLACSPQRLGPWRELKEGEEEGMKNSGNTWVKDEHIAVCSSMLSGKTEVKLGCEPWERNKLLSVEVIQSNWALT